MKEQQPVQAESEQYTPNPWAVRAGAAVALAYCALIVGIGVAEVVSHHDAATTPATTPSEHTAPIVSR